MSLNKRYIFPGGVDGVLEGTAATSYTSDFVAPSVKLTIGRVQLNNDISLYGDLDEVALRYRALTPAEIQSHYNKRSAGKEYFDGC